MNMPGIIATETQTSIAGFDVTKNTMISTSDIYEVGMSSSDSDEFAFWAGKANQFNPNPPFSVTHLGELNATKGHIANFVIDTNTIHAEDKDSIDSDEDGFYVANDGFAFKGDYSNVPSPDPDFTPSVKSEIKVKTYGKYGESYISNLMAYNLYQRINLFNTHNNVSTVSSNSSLPVVLGYYAAGSPYVSSGNHWKTRLVIYVYGWFSIPSKSWKIEDLTVAEDYQVPWNRLLAIHAQTYVVSNSSTLTIASGEGIIAYHDGKYKFGVYNSSNYSQYVYLTIIGERKDVPGIDEDDDINTGGNLDE